MSLASTSLPTLLPPWLIGQAQVTQLPVTDGFGLNVVHELGDGPDNLTTLLYDFDCKTPVTGAEAIGISNKTFSDANDLFSYEIDIYPLNINNSSLLTLDTTDVMTGKSIGRIKFCTAVVTQLDLSSTSDPDYLSVSFLKTQFELTFNLTRNEFSNELTLEFPTATSTVNVTLNVQQVPAPPTITEATAIANVLAAVLANILNAFPLPSNTQLTITPFLLNGFSFNNLLSGRRLQALPGLNFNFGLALTLTCTATIEQCQALQLQQLTLLMAQIQAALLQALLTGSLQEEIQTEAVTQNVTALQNATVPSTNNLNTTEIEHGEFTGVFAEEFDYDIYNQYSVTACQCDEFSLQCITGPTSVKQNEVFAICIKPSSTDVHISNLDMTISGDNGFTYSPVSYGDTSYVANAPITQVLDFHTILVKTYLVGGFFNVGDGSSTVSVTGNAFLENSPAKFSVTTSGSFEMSLKMDMDEEVVVDETEGGCFKNLLAKFIL